MQVNAVGRLSDPAQFGDIVVRTTKHRNTARIEVSGNELTVPLAGSNAPE